MNVLIIAINEICYNPRLIKAADYFESKGHSITVFNPLIGIGSDITYKNFKQRKPKWSIIENDISKVSVGSRINWLIASVSQKISAFLWKTFNWKYGFNFILNKGLLNFPYHKFNSYDVILINVVNNLPVAAILKRMYPKAILIYDSQEYFRGQYMHDADETRNWVNFAEGEFIYDADVVVATTEVMRQKLISDFKFRSASFRVRNLPLKHTLHENKDERLREDHLRIVWHGFVVNYESNRGVHILLQALSLCKCKFKFYLQGFISEVEKDKIVCFASANKIESSVFFIPPADPLKIIDSLINYDLGLIGEMPAEENQQLTSSNKLFEYIGAGLAVLVPDLPGLAETLDEFEVGAKYPSGDAKILSTLIDQLFNDQQMLIRLKKNSLNVAKEHLYWEKDFELVYSEVLKLAKRK